MESKPNHRGRPPGTLAPSPEEIARWRRIALSSRTWSEFLRRAAIPPNRARPRDWRLVARYGVRLRCYLCARPSTTTDYVGGRVRQVCGRHGGAR